MGHSYPSWKPVSVAVSSVASVFLAAVLLLLALPLASHAAPPSPLILVTKTADVTSVNAAGQVIHYTISVTNNSNSTLGPLVVSDPMLPGLTRSTDSSGDNDNDFEAGETWVYLGSYTVTQADIDTHAGGDGVISNTVSVGAFGILPENATALVYLTYSGPAIALTKTGVVSGDPFGVQAGTPVVYTFVATNTGNITLTNVALSDSLIGDFPIGTMGPGFVFIYIVVYNLTQSDVDAEVVVNTASVTSSEGATANATESVTFSGIFGTKFTKTGLLNPDIVPPNGEANPGDVVTYTFAVTNIGTATVPSALIADSLPLVYDINPLPSIAPGDTRTSTGNYTLTQADIDAGQVVNTANATVIYPDGGQRTDFAYETVMIPQFPDLVLTKTAALNTDVVPPNGVANPGDTITYTITANNTGNVTLNPLSITDSDIGLNQTISLAPGASANFTVTYVLTPFDLPGLPKNNVASASSPQLEDTVFAPNQILIPAVSRLSLVKTGTLHMDVVPPNNQVNVGDIITYTFSVNNTGNTNLGGVVVTDPLVSVNSTAPSISLTPGQSDNSTFTGSYAITQADIDAGQVVNTATATAFEGATATDTETVATPGIPSITLVKTSVLHMNVVPPNDQANAGDTITYTFSITNNGTVTLYNVVVTDPSVPVTGGPIASLAPGVTDSTTFTATHVLTQADIEAGYVGNTATVTATPRVGAAVEAVSSRITGFAQRPAIAMIKEGVLDRTVVPPDNEVNPGDVIYYGFTIANIGNVVITDVSITDPKISISGGPITLAPGQMDNTTFRGSYVITQADIEAGHVDNAAFAVGHRLGGEGVTASDEFTIDLRGPVPIPGLTGLGIGILVLTLGGAIALLTIRKRRNPRQIS